MDTKIPTSNLTLGDRIKLVRNRRSQAEFALLIGKKKGKVIMYEANVDTPSLLTLSKIAEIGDVTIDWLFHGSR